MDIVSMIVLYCIYQVVLKPLLFRWKFSKYTNVKITKRFVPFLGDLLLCLQDYNQDKLYNTHMKQGGEDCVKYDFQAEIESIQPVITLLSNRSMKQFIDLVPQKIDRTHIEKAIVKICPKALVHEPTTLKTQNRRKALVSLLSLNSCSKYTSLTLGLVQESLKTMKHKGEVNFQEEMGELTTIIFCKILFGSDVHHLLERKYPYINPDGTTEEVSLSNLFNKLANDHAQEYFNPLTSLLPFLNRYNLMNPWKRTWKNSETFKNCFRNIISLSKDPNSIATLLTQINKFSQEEIFDDLILLFIGGGDTSSHTLVSLFYYIAKNPNVKKKLLDEMNLNGINRDIDFDSVLTIDKINSLDYLSCVIKETMRIDPPGPTTLYYSTTENLKFCDVPLSKGTLMKVRIVNSHFNNKDWLEPDRFVPERFDPESEFYNRAIREGCSQNVYSLRPFGHGPRNCLGQTFAKQQLRVLATYLIVMMDYEIDKELLNKKDVGFAFGGHFVPKFIIS